LIERIRLLGAMSSVWPLWTRALLPCERLGPASLLQLPAARVRDEDQVRPTHVACMPSPCIIRGFQTTQRQFIHTRQVHWSDWYHPCSLPNATCPIDQHGSGIGLKRTWLLKLIPVLVQEGVLRAPAMQESKKAKSYTCNPIAAHAKWEE